MHSRKSLTFFALLNMFNGPLPKCCSHIANLKLIIYRDLSVEWMDSHVVKISRKIRKRLRDLRSKKLFLKDEIILFARLKC